MCTLRNSGARKSNKKGALEHPPNDGSHSISISLWTDKHIPWTCDMVKACQNEAIIKKNHQINIAKKLAMVAIYMCDDILIH